ncbi:MAG TPA: hypothetical protein PLQ93_13685, partial [Bacteroidia bacterium]|nr:hypothetical protein [Bacteroidia bacterium]
HLTHAHFQIQGAINTKTFIHKKVGIYDRYSYTSKLTEQPVKGELLDLDGQVRQWVSDSPEILRELAQADSMTASNRAKEKELRKADSLERAKAIADNNGKGLGLVERTKRDLALADRIYELGPKRTDLNPIVHNYNAWYEVKHPGKIKYTLTSPPLHEKTQLDLFLEQKRKPVTPGKQAAVSTTAPEVIDAAYVNRPTKASGEIASAKDNLPVKKESFDAKMERIKTDGNKVGVLFIHGSAKTKTKPALNSTGAGPSMSSGMGEDIYLDSEYKDTSLQSLGSDFTAELNTALRRNDIELVDLGNIPYRKSRVMGVETLQDDWWTTKYKVLFVYTIDPLLSVFQYTTAGNHKFEASLHFGSSVMVYEYIGGPESKEKETLAQMSGFGAFFTPKISEDQAILEVKPLYEKIVAALEYPLKEKIKTERSADITKLMEKN